MTDTNTIERSATLIIDRQPAEVFDAVADITRTGERSPECVGCSWVGDADGPELGARFTGDNMVKLGPITVKKWTTTSKVTACEPGEVFEFVAEGYTTWRYEMEPTGDGATRVTETCSFPPGDGFQGFLYDRLLRRPASLENGMKKTLAALKSELES